MSADTRGSESSAASRRWYLEVSGRRAGPFAWTVLVELAQAGALGADDRIWRMGLPSWCRAADLVDLATLMREPAPSRTFARPDRSLRAKAVRWGIPLLAVLAALLLLATAVSTRRPSQVPSRQSLAAYASRASVFEGRYPFLAELQRVEPTRFDRLDRALRLGFRRGAPAAELNGFVAATANDIERGRLADVDAGSALRLLVELRTAARRFQSLDPAQCVAILEPQAAAAPIRSAAALAAISPALVGLLDAPVRPQRQTPPSAAPDAPHVNPKLDCDRLLLMYDAAVASNADAGAAFIRALQGDSGH